MRFTFIRAALHDIVNSLLVHVHDSDSGKPERALTILSVGGIAADAWEKNPYTFTRTDISGLLRFSFAADEPCMTAMAGWRICKITCFDLQLLVHAQQQLDIFLLEELEKPYIGIH